MEAYLDNAATTRVFPEVRDIMLQVMGKDFGDRSSRHTKGIDAEGVCHKGGAADRIDIEVPAEGDCADLRRYREQ